MENTMRQVYLTGATAFFLGWGAMGANALPMNEEASPNFVADQQQARPSYGPPPASPMQEGRAVFLDGDSPQALGDILRRRPTSNGYHDPAFSRQQDDIYNGRF
jgi:hypothetical protein